MKERNQAEYVRFRKRMLAKCLKSDLQKADYMRWSWGLSLCVRSLHNELVAWLEEDVREPVAEGKRRATVDA